MKNLNDNDAAFLIEEYNRVTNDLNELEKLKKQLRVQLLELKESQNDDQFKVGRFLLKFNEVTRKIFDKKNYLELNGDDSLDDYLKESKAVIIKVKAA